MSSSSIIPKSQPEINYAQEDEEHQQENPFLIDLIRRRERRYMRFLLLLSIRKEKLVLS
jgi:hypothetical protein